jgi:hypothetical protein
VSQVDQYVARAAAATLGLLDEHYALVHAELEARIAEASHVGSTDNIDIDRLARPPGLLHGAAVEWINLLWINLA